MDLPVQSEKHRAVLACLSSSCLSVALIELSETVVSLLMPVTCSQQYRRLTGSVRNQDEIQMLNRPQWHKPTRLEETPMYAILHISRRVLWPKILTTFSALRTFLSLSYCYQFPEEKPTRKKAYQWSSVIYPTKKICKLAFLFTATRVGNFSWDHLLFLSFPGLRKLITYTSAHTSTHCFL